MCGIKVFSNIKPISYRTPNSKLCDNFNINDKLYGAGKYFTNFVKNVEKWQ